MYVMQEMCMCVEMSQMTKERGNLFAAMTHGFKLRG